MLKRKLFYIIIASVFMTANIFAQSQDPPTAEDLAQQIITKQLTDIAESKWEYKVEYPELQLEGGKTAVGFSKLSNEIALEQIKDFRKMMSEMTDNDWKQKSKDMLYEMTFGFDVEYLTKDFISVSFGRYAYTGGAHGNGQTITLNYDLKNDKPLMLTDLFVKNSNYLEVISKNSIEQIIKKQGEYADKDWIEKGAGAKLDNFRNWSITQNGLKFVFDQYQVGPYAAGTFETLLPLTKFEYATVTPFFNTLVSATYINGNPPNWCRNGHFPSHTSEFKLAKVKEKVNFSGDDKGCPIGSDCKEKSYVIKEDEVIIGRTYQDFACVWYQPQNGTETVGWLPLDKLTVSENIAKKYDWTGEWSYYENSIKIIPEKNVGDYVVSGTAFWKGVGDNVHVGEIEGTVSPPYGYAMIGEDSEKYDCKVELRRIGKYLIISDNSNCGGANVRFDGVYTQNAKNESINNADMECSIDNFAEMTYNDERDLDFRLGTIKTTKKQPRAYFVSQNNDKIKSYLVKGDKVIVSKNNGKNACVWYQPKKGKETIGLIPLNNLAFQPSSAIRQSWVGTWEYGESEIKVIPQKRVGSYKFIGKTFWVGKGEGNVSIGDIDFVASPNANRLTRNGTENMKECKIKMQIIGDFLIASDNQRCGGRNVTFGGVYRKK